MTTFLQKFLAKCINFKILSLGFKIQVSEF